MARTLICTLDHGPGAAATAAFGVWLGECLGARLLVCGASAADDVIAVADEHRAELVVTAAATGADRRRVLELTRCLRGSLCVLPPDAISRWLDPPEARRLARRLIVAGCNGTAASIAAARTAGRIAAGLGGSTVVAHVQARPPHGLPMTAVAARDPDPIAVEEAARRRRLIAPALGAARRCGAAVEGHLAEGNAVTALADLAAAERAPMIAVGSSRPDKTRIALVGSVTLELISRAASPVLIALCDPPAPRRASVATAGATHPPTEIGRSSAGNLTPA